MNVVVYARDPLIFRDGRPFGEFGAVRSGALQWPMPSTVAGMLRSRIGLNRAVDFFQEIDAISRICNIHVTYTQPVCRTDWEPWRPVYPNPADVLVCEDKDDKLSFHGFDYAKPGTNGVGLPWKNWRIPLPTTSKKPARNQPAFWHESVYMKWLTSQETIKKSITIDELGWPLPYQDQRVHCAIDNHSGAAAEGQLWTSSGLCMQRYVRGKGLKQWGIVVQLSGCEQDDDVAGPTHLGGDRRLAFIEETDVMPPARPDDFADAHFLRLLLITPGSFGGWAPDWLLPADAFNQNETPWVKVPGTDHNVRLSSAFVPRWMPISGWDYAEKRQKAMRKLIPAGAVYVVEVQERETSRAIANHLWGKPLVQGDIDGCGVCMVGRANINL